MRAGTGAVNRCAYRSVNRACPHTKAVEAVTGRNIPIQPTAADATGTGTPSLCRRPQTCQEFGHGQNLGSPHTNTPQGCIWSEHTYTSYRASADRCGHGLGFKKNFQKIFEKIFKARAVPAPGVGVSLGPPSVLPAHNKNLEAAGAKAKFFAEMGWNFF